MALKQKVLESCLNFRPNPDEWVWQKTKKQFRRQLFPNTTLCIDPLISFNNYRGLMQPQVHVLYKPYQKLYRKLGFPNTYDYCWGFRIGDYYKDYPSSLLIWKNLPPDSRSSWHLPDRVPSLLQTMIDLGMDIFEAELDLSTEEAFEKSMLLKQADISLKVRYSNNIGLHRQAILHLMRGNIDYLYWMRDNFQNRGGTHLKAIPRIIQLVEEQGLEALVSETEILIVANMDSKDTEFEIALTPPQWIIERYKESNGFEPNRLVSDLLDIPVDIQVFAIAAHGYTAKPWETSFWEQFEKTKVAGVTRQELMKTQTGRNAIRNQLLKWVTSAWY